ncbi:hypothetical protein Tco_0501726 [Tanacetum coccineum]
MPYSQYRNVGIKRLHDDLRVTIAQLVLLVRSYNCLFRVNATGTKLQLLKGHILHVHPAKDAIPSYNKKKYQLYLTIKEDPQLQKYDVSIWLALKIKFEDFRWPLLLKISEHETFEIGGSSSGQDYEGELCPSTSGNQEQSDEFDYWKNSYAINNDVLPNEKVSQELVDEISQTVDEAKLRKVVDEMLRQQCTLRDEHQCKRDPKAPGLPLVNQDLLYLKKGNSRPDKIVLSLHKFPAFIFPDDDIEERTSRWVKKCVKRFNPYARYGVKHWKNPHAKIFYIKNQQAAGKPKEEIYSNSKIVQIIKTY